MADRSEAGDGEARAIASRDVKYSWLTIPRDLFYVDFLGVLVPGLFTVLLGSVVVATTVLTARMILFHLKDQDIPTIDQYVRLVDGGQYGLGIVSFVLAYIIGTALFRQGTNRPDFLSALQVWLTATDEDRCGLAAQRTDWHSTKRKKRFPEDGPIVRRIFWLAYLKLKRMAGLEKFDAQFPYKYMRCYLAARGLFHLVDYIPWCPNIPASMSHRSKMYINVLKVRLSDLAPNYGRDVVRNEAHVRLATSVWYAANTLVALTAICLSFLALVLITRYWFHQAIDLAPLYNPAAVFVVILALCWLLHHQLRKCIHYMRVREVVYVLEAAYLASADKPIGFRIPDLPAAQEFAPCDKCPRLLAAAKSKTHEAAHDSSAESAS